MSTHTVNLALHAMNTRFELVLHGEHPPALRAAGEEALREIERIENVFSAFRPASEIFHLNTRAANGPVQVSSEVIELLLQASELNQRCDGAFDITVGPLMQCWGFWGASGRVPVSSDIQQARTCVGMEHLEVDEARRTVRFLRLGMMLDFGAIGKGYAIERAAEILQDNAITSALLHGGTSTVYAIGHPPDQDAWRVAIHDPQPSAQDVARLLATIELRDEAVSISAVSEKSFRAEGATYGHVIDPRSGWPVPGALLSAVVTRSATEADALSTGLMVLGGSGLEHLCATDECRGLVVEETADSARVRCRGIELAGTGSHELNTGTFAASFPLYVG